MDVECCGDPGGEPSVVVGAMGGGGGWRGPCGVGMLLWSSWSVGSASTHGWVVLRSLVVAAPWWEAVPGFHIGWYRRYGARYGCGSGR